MTDRLAVAAPAEFFYILPHSNEEVGFYTSCMCGVWVSK